MTGDAIVGLLGAAAITGGLLFIALRLLGRLHRGGAGRGKLPLSVLQRHPLGPKQGIALVRVGRRVLVLATSGHGSRLLTELRGEDRLALVADDPPPRPSRKDPELKQLLARLTLALALVLGGSAGLVSAQARPTAPRADSGVQAAVSPPTSIAPARPAAAAGAPRNVRVAPPPAPTVELKVGEGKEQLRLSGTVGLVVFLGALTLLPAVVLLMTSFTRILVVLHFLRSALGTQGSPPGQLLVAIAVLLTGVVMAPVLDEVNGTALRPYLDVLDEPDRDAFLADYGARLGAAYPQQPDGRTLLPFRRLFLIAQV